MASGTHLFDDMLTLSQFTRPEHDLVFTIVHEVAGAAWSGLSGGAILLIPDRWRGDPQIVIRFLQQCGILMAIDAKFWAGGKVKP